jgi:TolB protein
MKQLLPIFVTAGFAAAPTAAQAQEPAPVIAVPPLSTPEDKQTSIGSTRTIAWQATQLIASDLASTTDLMALPPDQQKDFYSYPEVTAPSFPRWRQRGAKALITGFVQARSDGRLTVGCYVYDVEKGRELGRAGFVVAPREWRRAAHKCSGLAYKSVTGSPGIFDTRIAYVAQTGAPNARVSRIAVVGSDGFDHNYVTAGDTMVLTPRLSPKGDRVAFVSYSGGKPQVRIADLGSGQQRPLIPNDEMSFAPRFSPDGRRIAFSMQFGSNIEIYVADASGGGMAQRLTTSPGIDTDPSFSPDGTKILFESDRSGSQQLYVMDANGSNQRRISFGGGWYGSPEWSPDGERIVFTRRGADGLRIGIMNANGTGERLLTSGPKDESPNWAASSRELIFQRTDPAGSSAIYRLSVGGGEPRKVQTPQDASDPDWSGALD